MSFILKNNINVINIKLTNKGREQLSKGSLKFSKFAIGDSEIDYGFNKDNNINPSLLNILRPKDINPDIASYVLRDNNEEKKKYDLPPITSIPSVITNTAENRGFSFLTKDNERELYSDILHVKQADGSILISTVTGGTKLIINKSTTYIGNITEPEIGDYLLVKWTNPQYNNNTDFKVTTPLPVIWYKIENIISGSLGNNDLVIIVDKVLPNFNGNGDDLTAVAMFYPNNKNRDVFGDSIQQYYGSPYVTDFISESVFSFFENYDIPTIKVPVWNMSIVFTENIIGIDDNHVGVDKFYSNKFNGFIKYIQQINENIKNIGIIHYTNSSPSNNYGEGFVDGTPELYLPTIMWHKNISSKMGLTLKSGIEKKYMPNLNTEYRDLIDDNGFVVGKVFNDLKIFVIEDQELLFAMSYKSNRNWTIPKIKANFNATTCDECTLTCYGSPSTPSTIGGNDGSITIITIGQKGTVSYSIDGGQTSQSNNVFTGLQAGNYVITVFDSGSSNCIGVVETTIAEPISNISITNIEIS